MGVIEASDRAWKVVQMSENVSAAECLRGIIDECGVSGTMPRSLSRCSTSAKSRCGGW